ncbi:MAG: SDR family NAD(P)-dependent oxidoreductase [Bacteroidales bacterium]|nr:SDR family NAD(P)-dependent oxidoreductase [Bacteroidales bacterium]
MKKTPKVILVTGASSGIGFQTAQMLANQGHRVYAAARRTELMQPLEQHGVTVLRLDICDDASINECVRQIVENEGRIDVLVNNAGYGYFGAVETVAIDEARRQFEVNLFGLARLTQIVLPLMRANKGGHIINLASIAGHMAIPFGAWYNATKYAVEGFSDALRMEVRQFGIKVVMIEPGGIKTNWGIIAADHLEGSSKGTAYEEIAMNEAALLRKGYTMDLLSDPSKVAKTIVKAANRKRPKTRYLVGRGAHLMMFLKHVLPYKWWDKIGALMWRHYKIVDKSTNQ